MALLILPVRALAQCDDWRAGPLSELAGVDGGVYAISAWDSDGAGPLSPYLIAGGSITSAGGASASGIARWDGLSWQPLGSGVTFGGQSAGEVYALAVLPDSMGAIGGQLVAGGDFDEAGGVAADAVARWDGTAWHPMKGLANSFGTPLAIWQLYVMPDNAASLAGRLIAAGDFDLVGGLPTNNRLASWDGAAWHTIVQTPVPSVPYGWTSWDPDGAGPQAPELDSLGHKRLC